MNDVIRKLDGANMDIDLVTPIDQIVWSKILVLGILLRVLLSIRAL
jgi:hypothetical protein